MSQPLPVDLRYLGAQSIARVGPGDPKRPTFKLLRAAHGRLVLGPTTSACPSRSIGPDWAGVTGSGRCADRSANLDVGGLVQATQFACWTNGAAQSVEQESAFWQIEESLT